MGAKVLEAGKSKRTIRNNEKKYWLYHLFNNSMVTITIQEKTITFT